ncbi:MAG: hypothetical protein V2I47_03200 [Bacteroidales bacterium]|jgi:hypothetical protein|nr:hypothetical protein [Bacteroidales bacterium]
MKSFTYIPLWFMSLMLLLPETQAQFSDDNKLKLGGYIYIDNRVRTEDGAWSWNENRLNLELKKNFNNKGAFYSDIWLRSFGFPFLTGTDQLFNTDDVSPYNLQIREAYIDIYDFLLEGLDLRVGRQRIAWGTGDRINPTDNLNSDDLEDIWDFGRHLGSDGFKFDYYFSDYHLEAVYIPFFTPAVLPRGDWSDAFMPFPDLPPMVELGTLSDSLATPQYKIGESSSYGLKFGGFLLGYDFSLSYVYNRDDFPIQYYNFITLNPPNLIDIKSDLFYHRQHVFGADISGAIGSVGIWGELGVFLPEKEVVMTTDLSALGMPPQDSVVLKKQAYARYVVGMDYTFMDGSYFNFQFFHGFVTERGQGNLNDYFMLAWEKNLFNDKLKIIPLAGAFIVSDWDDIGNNYAWIYSPAISYYPNINTEINLGCRIIDGEGDNTFALVKDYDEIFLSIKFNF